MTDTDLTSFPYTATCTFTPYQMTWTCNSGASLAVRDLMTTTTPFVWPSGTPSFLVTNVTNLNDVATLQATRPNLGLSHTVHVTIKASPRPDYTDMVVDMMFMSSWNADIGASYNLQNLCQSSSGLCEVDYTGIVTYANNNPAGTQEQPPSKCFWSAISPCINTNSTGDCSENDTNGDGHCNCCGSDDCYSYSESIAQYQVTQGTPQQWTNSATYPTMMQVFVQDQCGSGSSLKLCDNAGCDCHAVKNFSIIIVVDTVLTFDCTGAGVDDPVCISNCLDPVTNVNNCFNTYMGGCFGTGLPSTQLIDEMELTPGADIDINADTWTGSCRRYFRTYIANNQTSVAELDDNITNYCKVKYPTIPDLLNTGLSFSLENDLDVCGCHLSDSQYAALKTAVDTKYPPLTEITNQGQCFLSPCIESNYPTTYKCPGPSCIEIINFSNSGIINQSNVNFNQNANCVTQACANYTGPSNSVCSDPSPKPTPTPPPNPNGPPPPPPPTGTTTPALTLTTGKQPPPVPKPTPTSNAWIYAVGIAVFFFALIIIITMVLLLVFKSKPHRHPTAPVQSASFTPR